MKIILVNMCFVSLFVFSACNTEKASTLQVHVSNIKQKSVDRELEKWGCFFSAQIDLVNNTDTIIRFWTMKCSWQDLWISNTRNLFVFNPGCDANYPIVEQLNPGQTRTYSGILCYSDTVKPVCENEFMLGFKIIYENEYSDDFNFYFYRFLSQRPECSQNIIWSNVFRLDSCEKKVR